MKKGVTTIVTAMLTVLTVVTSCIDDDMQQGEVPVSMAFSVASAPATRLSESITQTANSGTLRTLTDVYAIPFDTQGTIGADDAPLSHQPTMERLSTGASLYYLDQTYEMPQRTASFLCYARALPSGDGTKAVNGSIQVPALGARQLARNIVFNPDPIYPQDAASPQAVAMTNYLTNIVKANATIGASTYYWATTTDANLHMLFEYFTNEGALMAGSSKSVEALVANLRTSVERLTTAPGTAQAALRQAILNAIDAGSIVGDYPASIGLPDGAAVVRWVENGNTFMPETQATTLSKMVSQSRYVYPAELYYYANSRINTSNSPKTASDYEGKAWNEILSGFEHHEGVVNRNTRSAAIIDPLTHAVGCLKATVKANNAALTDANMQTLTLTPTTFPLTGLLVSGQYSQNYNFEPSATDLTEYVVYDNRMGDIALMQTDSPETFYTLTYQTKENDDPVWIALEFENNSGRAFHGCNGVVYPGTKFYLMAALSRPESPDPTKDYEQRVFTKNYITQANMVVNGLEKAYNVIPDLLSARLEIGVELTTGWIEATTTSVILK